MSGTWERKIFGVIKIELKEAVTLDAWVWRQESSGKEEADCPNDREKQ